MNFVNTESQYQSQLLDIIEAGLNPGVLLPEGGEKGACHDR